MWTYTLDPNDWIDFHLLGSAVRHSAAVEIFGPLLISKLRTSWFEVARIRGLDRVIDTGADTQSQIQDSRRKPSFEFFDGGGLSREEEKRRLNGYVETEVVAVDDLAPLIKIAVVRLTDERHVLLWLQHPAWTDFSGVGAIVQELLETYDETTPSGADCLLPEPLPEVSIDLMPSRTSATISRSELSAPPTAHFFSTAFAIALPDHGDRDQFTFWFANNLAAPVLRSSKFPTLQDFRQSHGQISDESVAPLQTELESLFDRIETFPDSFVLYLLEEHEIRSSALSARIVEFRNAMLDPCLHCQVWLSRENVHFVIEAPRFALCRGFLERFIERLRANPQQVTGRLGPFPPSDISSKLNVNIASTVISDPLSQTIPNLFDEIGIEAEVHLLKGNVLDRLYAISASVWNPCIFLLRLDEWMSPRLKCPQVNNAAALLPDDIRTTTLPNGWQIAEYLPNETQQMYREIFIDLEYLKHGIRLPSDAIVIDAGANIGLFSLFVSAMCDKAQIHAFEPFPSIARILKANQALYGLPIRIHQTALSDFDGRTKAGFCAKSSLQSGLFNDQNQDTKVVYHYAQNQWSNELAEPVLMDLVSQRVQFQTQDIEVHRLSTIIKQENLERIDLLKIDVEKSESLLLGGIAPDDWTRIRQIVAEVHDIDASLAQLVNRLRWQGFEVVTEQSPSFQRTNIYLIYAWRPDNPEVSHLSDFLKDRSARFVDGIRALPEEAQRHLFIGLIPSESHSSKEKERSLLEQLENETEVSLLDFDRIARRYTLEPNVQENGRPMPNQARVNGWQESTIPIGWIGALSAEIVRQITRPLRSPAKVLAVDADNTLWDGICGEDDPQGIRLDDSHMAFQRFLLEQKAKGKLLCLVSRNNEKDLEAVFDRHAEMPLRQSDFVSRRINWDQKPNNLRSLADELNLGLDSFVFIDDDKREREAIRALCPEVTVVDLPKLHAGWVDALEQTWILDQDAPIEADRNRHKAYLADKSRSRLRAGAATFREYLNSLELKIALNPAQLDEAPRLAQLSRRTTQFNLANISHRQENIEKRTYDSGTLYSIHVQDRFLDFGVVGMVNLTIEDKIPVLSEFLLSCRVLGRNIEWFVLTAIARQLHDAGYQNLSCYFRRTNRNTPARQFLLNALSLTGKEEADILATGHHILDLSPFLDLDWKAPIEERHEDEPPSPPMRKGIAYRWPAPYQDKSSRPSEKRRRPTLPVQLQLPVSPIELELGAIFQDELDISEIGVHDGFGSLGGDSLAALRLTTRIKERWGLAIPLQTILDDISITGCVAILSAHEGEKDSGNETAAPISDQDAWLSGELSFPASPGQARLWAAEAMSESNHQIIPLSYEINGPLRSDTLAMALSALVERHQALRTVLFTKGKRLYQKLGPNRFRLRTEKTSGSTHQADFLEKTIISERFDLRSGNLLKALLIEVRPDLHRLILVVHHAACDGWSIGLMIRQLGAIYAHLSHEGWPAPEPPKRQFIDFVVQVEQDESHLSHQAEAWATLLRKNASRAVGRSVLTGSETRLLDLHLPGAWQERIKQTAADRSVTTFTVFLAALELVLLQRGLIQPIVVPFANRVDPQDTNTVGFITNLLVIPVTDTQSANPASHLKDLSERVLQTFTHGNLPFSEISRRIAVPEVMFTQQPLNDVPCVLPGLNVSRREPAWWPSPFPLMVDVETEEANLRIRFRYQTRRFSDALVTLLAEQYRFCLRLILAAPKADMTTVFGWLAGIAAAKPAASLHDDPVSALATWARRRPEAVALRCNEGNMNYAELQDRVERTAARLAEMVPEQETPVAIALARTPALLVGLLAVARAGRPFVPLDIHQPYNRLKQLLSQCGAGLILVDDTSPLVEMQLTCPTVTVDSLSNSPALESPAPDPARNRQGYLLFTSGSTGNPKAVQVPWSALCNYLRFAADAYDEKGIGTLVFSAIAVDFTITSLFVPILLGETCILVSEDGPEALARALSHNPGLSFLKVTPSMLNLLRHATGAEGLAAATSLLVVGGEALRSNHLTFLADCDPPLRVVNEYGPTEATVGCCIHSVMTNRLPDGPIPIGNPIDGTWATVRDPQGNPAAEGELHIGGACLATGYHGQPDQTARSWVRNDKDQLEYRTGDLVRRSEDGVLHYLARLDTQLKVQGYRVEPAEVETALLSHDRVASCAVVQSRKFAGRLSAFIIPENNGRDDALLPDTLRRWARERLPNHMIPSSFHVVQDFPMKMNGKLDRDLLGEMEDISSLASNTGAKRPLSSPTSDIESLIGMIWATELKCKGIGRDDDFFALGGDSIMALFVASACRQHGIILTAQSIFEHRTLAAVAAHARQEATPNAPSDEDKVPVLTPNQNAFFALNLSRPEHWNLSWFGRTPDSLNRSVMEKAVAALSQRHPQLHSRFYREENKWRVVLADCPEDSLSMDWIECPGHDDTWVEKKIVECQGSLDLKTGPVSRLLIFDLGYERRLFWVIHHLLVDLVSFHVLLKELVQIYRAQSGEDGRPLPLPGGSKMKAYISSGWPLPWQTVDDLPLESEIETRQHRIGLTQRLPATEILPRLLKALADAWMDLTDETALTLVCEQHGRDATDLDLSGSVGWYSRYLPFEIVKRSSKTSLASIKDSLKRRPNGHLLPGAVLVNFLAYADSFEVAPFETLWLSHRSDRHDQNVRPFPVEVIASVREDCDLLLTFSFSPRLHSQSFIGRWARTCGENFSEQDGQEEIRIQNNHLSASDLTRILAELNE